MSMIAIGILFPLAEFTQIEESFQLKPFRPLLLRNLEGRQEITLGLIHILTRSQVCFAKQSIYFTCVEAFGAEFAIAPRFCLFQKLDRLLETLIFYVRITQQAQGVVLK